MGHNAVMAPADKSESSPESPAESRPEPAAAAASDTPTDDDLRQRFRDALAHKHGGGPHGSAGYPGSKSNAPVSNEKRQRTFRRKSG